MILNVKVDGDTLVRSGGLHSIYIVGSTLGEVEVNKHLAMLESRLMTRVK